MKYRDFINIKQCNFLLKCVTQQIPSGWHLGAFLLCICFMNGDPNNFGHSGSCPLVTPKRGMTNMLEKLDIASWHNWVVANCSMESAFSRALTWAMLQIFELGARRSRRASLSGEQDKGRWQRSLEKFVTSRKLDFHWSKRYVRFTFET
jgi:hypothetical protein